MWGVKNTAEQSVCSFIPYYLFAVFHYEVEKINKIAILLSFF
jgi:hypothetical protein